jgi:hypothetical protein
MALISLLAARDAAAASPLSMQVAEKSWQKQKAAEAASSHRLTPASEHDPEKWMPGFRQDHAETKLEPIPIVPGWNML